MPRWIADFLGILFAVFVVICIAIATGAVLGAAVAAGAWLISLLC
jgi:hypothetical protein